MQAARFSAIIYGETMMQSSLFFDKFFSRIDKVDPARLKVHLERLRREWKRQETIFQTIQEGVVVLDARGCLSEANRAAEKLLSFKADQMRGKSMAPFFEDIDFGAFAEGAEKEENGRAPWSRMVSHETEISYPERRILSVYAVPLPGPDETGEPNILVILRDVTAEREQEASALEGERGAVGGEDKPPFAAPVRRRRLGEAKGGDLRGQSRQRTGGEERKCGFHGTSMAMR